MATYTLELESRVEEGRDVYAFQTADGVVSKDEFRTSELMLLGTVVPDRDDDILVVDGNYGVVGTVLADIAPEGWVSLTETSARAANLCNLNLAENGIDNADVTLTADVSEDCEAGFDKAAFAPRPYDPIEVVQERICQVLTRLREGGTLTVAARKNEGAKRYRRTMKELTGDVENVEKQQGVRVYRCVRDESFAPEQYVRERTIEATARNHTCSFLTRPGLFSAGHLDTGTRHLIEELPVEDGDDVLDLACGYGPVGTFASKVADCDVWMTDDDVIATTYARRNASKNDVEPEAVVTADGVEAVREETFDLVASNPPTHAGQGIIEELFAGTADVLSAGGTFALVYNDVLGYEEQLPKWFSSVEVVRNADDFNVTLATKR